MTARFAEVVVDVRGRGLSEPFDYAVPELLQECIGVGSSVAVPLGPRTVLGHVTALKATTEFDSVRDVLAASSGAEFAEHAPHIAAWIARRYVCGISDALRPFLPPGKGATLTRLPDGSHEIEPASSQDVTERWLALAPDADASSISTRAFRQRAVFDALTGGPVSAGELRASLGQIDSPLRSLIDTGLVVETRKRRWRTPTGRDYAAPRPGDLTRGQTDSLDAIRAAGSGQRVLLDGVTGSGKTEVYLRAIEDVRQAGQTAIVLVPEISLTPQTVGRFRSRFGGDVAVLHSRMSPGERFDQWDLVRSKDAGVVVGPRSALFAPVADLGLIVVDEEHDQSYKQDSTPRYHARDVATALAEHTGARVVLGSATPSLEILEECRADRCIRVALPERATGAQLPDVDVVDMTQEFAQGNRSMFSRTLSHRLEEVLSSQGKAVLLLNRRGFASFLLCRECGHVPTCDACSVSLKFHQTSGLIRCHHCDAVRPVPAECPECASPYLRLFGAGTQRVEAELLERFPGITVIRMDADTTKGKGGHESRLAEFESAKSAILVGTQMIAKGLDYPEVTLVGILDADTGLRIPDFRAAERAFQLLVQVSGRAGRGESPGTVVIQTYWPDHYAVRAAARHDHESFYAAEEELRKELSFPPYTRLADIRVSGPDESNVKEIVARIAVELENGPDDVPRTVVGPAPSVIEKLRGEYRWHVMVKADDAEALSGAVREAIRSVRPPSGVTIVPDVDPVGML